MYLEGNLSEARIIHVFRPKMTVDITYVSFFSIFLQGGFEYPTRAQPYANFDGIYIYNSLQLEFFWDFIFCCESVQGHIKTSPRVY